MPKVSVPRNWIADGSLPPVCVVCGADARHHLFPGVSSPSLAWVLFSPLIGLLTFWGYILLGGGQRGEEAGLPFCDRHRGYWPRRARFIVGGFVALVGLMVAAVALTPPAAPGKEEPHWLFGVAGCWMLVFLPTFLIVHLTAMRPTGGNRKSLVLSGASREFGAAVTGERGHSVGGDG
jgi:hypothetical protein